MLMALAKIPGVIAKGDDLSIHGEVGIEEPDAGIGFDVIHFEVGANRGPKIGERHLLAIAFQDAASRFNHASFFHF